MYIGVFLNIFYFSHFFFSWPFSLISLSAFRFLGFFPPIFIQYSLLNFHLTLFSLGCLVILFIYEMVVFYFDSISFLSSINSLAFLPVFLFISILSFYISDSRIFFYRKTCLRAFNSVWIFVLELSSWLAFMERIFISWFLFCY